MPNSHTPAARRWSTATALTALGAAAPAVLAHTGGDAGHAHGVVQALAQGFTHPFTGLDHLVAMLAVGAWSALTMARAGAESVAAASPASPHAATLPSPPTLSLPGPMAAPLAFATALLVGALFAMAGLGLPAIEPMIAASLLALGLLLVTRARLPLAAGMALAAGFALFHGAAHGQALAGPAAAWALAGMVAATALLHAGGIALGLWVARRSVWMPRVAGAAVAAFGVVLLLPALAGGPA